MGKLRILHVYQSPSFSGAEAYASDVARFQTKSAEITFLVRGSSPLENHLKNLSSDIKVVHSLADVSLADFDVAILHSTQELKHHWPQLAIAKIKAKLAGRKPLKVVVYSHIWISHSKRDPLHLIAYSVVDRFWCSSEKSRSELVRYLPLDSRRIEVVRYGRETKRLLELFLDKSAARKKLGLPEDAVVVGTIARIDKGKGSRELFDSVTDLMQSRADLHLLMVGPPTSSDPKAIELDKQIDRDIESLTPQIRSRVHKLGRLENGTLYLKAFDLFVLATYKENFALTLLEALLCEVPCLATDSGGSPDVVHPHSTGWLFWPENVISLRDNLLTALEQKDKWSDFGRRGRSLVVQNFDFENVMLDANRRLENLVEAENRFI